MTTTWVVIADSSRARICATDNLAGPLQELTDLVHPASRLSEQELTSDRPGRAFDSAGQGRHAMEPQHTSKQHEAAKFAKTIADHLNKARTDHRFERLILVAGPAFLGLLRESINPQTMKLVVREIAKDLGSVDLAEIETHLQP